MEGEAAKLPFEIIEDYMFVRLEQPNGTVLTALFDTGSPMTHSNLKEALILGKKCEFRWPLMSFSAYLTTKFDILLGLDFLKSYYFEISFKEKMITFHSKCTSGPECTAIPLTPGPLGLDSIDINVGSPEKKALSAMIDTGAPIAYIHHLFLPSLAPTGIIKKDFSPLLGEKTWETNIYTTSVGFPQLDLTLEAQTFGVLPLEYERLFLSHGPLAVLGQEFISQFEYVGFDYQEKRVVLGPKIKK